MRKRILAVLVVAVASCACGSQDTTGPSSVLSLADPMTVVRADVVKPAVQPQETPTPEPTVEPTEEPTPEPTSTPDPCPTSIAQSTWIGPMATITGTRAYVRCEAPSDLPKECNAGMSYVWSHVPNDGFYSVQAGEPLPDDGMFIDSTVFPNGPIALYCSPMSYNGLPYPNASEVVVEVVN